MTTEYVNQIARIIAKASNLDPDMAASKAGLGMMEGTVADYFLPAAVEIIRALVKAGWKPPEASQ